VTRNRPLLRPSAAAVSGLSRSDPRGPGITRVPGSAGSGYRDPAGSQVTDAETLARIAALAIPPAWTSVWISADPSGHIQATGTDSRGRLQYRYHELWREQRDAEKFEHMLRFAAALPALRAAALRDLRAPGLNRDRVTASAVRLIDVGLFRIGGERYAELDHHYGVTTLLKRHVRLVRGAIAFDFIAKEGKRRAITIGDPVIVPAVRSLARRDNGLDALFCWQQDSAWHPLHSHDVSDYIAAHAGGHFTAKEFRTWNATVLMAILLANAGPSPAARQRTGVIAGCVRGVAELLGDTPAVTRKSYVDPRLISRYEADGQLPSVPVGPATLPVPEDAELAVAQLLADGLPVFLIVRRPGATVTKTGKPLRRASKTQEETGE
jgi:DNA topoisomerase IB